MSLILDGTNGLSDIDGTAATPAIRGTDTNTGIFFPAADTIAFAEGGVESMRIDGSGNVGIGNTTMVGRLRTTVAANNIIALFNGTTYGLTLTSSSSESGAKLEATDPTGTASFQPLILSGSIQQFKTGGTERMRIDSSGNVLIGATTSNGARINLFGDSGLYGTAEFGSSKGTNNSHIHYGSTGDWYIRPASLSGSVYVRNYVAESDARLKTNIEPIPYGLNDVLALQPKKFNWIDGGEVENNGFIAQEVEAVLPALVSEGQWKSVDYQGITAIIVKAIQELKTELDSVKAELATLKGAA
jgi:hypothetical protein